MWISSRCQGQQGRVLLQEVEQVSQFRRIAELGSRRWVAGCRSGKVFHSSETLAQTLRSRWRRFSSMAEIGVGRL